MTVLAADPLRPAVLVPSGDHGPERFAEPPRSAARQAWRKFSRHRLAVGSLAVLAAIVLAVLAGPALSPYDPQRMDLGAQNRGPSGAHPLGTDELGRDQLVRVLDGGRLSLVVALVSVGIAMSLGVAVGVIAGYAGGLADNLLMRVVDVFYSVPGLLAAILLVALVGPGFWTIVAALGLMRWMPAARLVRAGFLSLREAEFVQSARGLGAGPGRVVLRHLLPNVLSPVIVTATLGVARAVLAESALSFLGLGLQPPQATWGRMLYEAQTVVIHEGHWWRGFFPGLMIFLCILCVNFVGDGLRDVFDPRKVHARHDP